MKRHSKRAYALLVALIFALTTLSPLTVMAAYGYGGANEPLQIQLNETTKSDLFVGINGDAIPSARSAIPVTGLWAESLQILPNGNVQLVMLVAGQGSFIQHWSSLGASRLVAINPAAGIAPITHFRHVFDIGPARVGAHWFDFTLRCLRTGDMVSNRVDFSIW